MEFKGFFKNKSEEEIQKNQELINAAVANTEESLNESQEVELSSLSHVPKEKQEYGELAEEIFLTTAQERINDLVDQIEKIQSHIEQSSGADIAWFNGIITTKKQLEDQCAAITKELEDVDDNKMQDPRYMQKHQELQNIQNHLNIITHNIATLESNIHPTITPEEEKQLEEKLEVLREECTKLQDILTSISFTHGQKPENLN